MKTSNKTISPWFWVPTLYFAEGVPYFVVNNISVMMFTKMGVPNGDMAFFTTLLYFPWFLKGLWGPLVDVVKTKRWWILSMQVLMTALMILLTVTLPKPDVATIASGQTPISMFTITLILFIIAAFASATHDIAADGTYMSVLSKEEQAKWIGWQGAFYNIAKIAATGGLVYLAGVFIKHFGVTTAWMVIMLIIAVIMCALGLYHIFILPATSNATSAEDKNLGEALRELWNVFADFFKKKHIVYYLFFIILYRFCEGFVMKIVPLFLKAPRTEQGLGLSEQELSLIHI